MSKKRESDLWNLLVGAIATVALCVGIVAGYAKLLLLQMIGVNSLEWTVNIILFISALGGSLIMLCLHRERPKYTGILLLIVLFLSIMLASLIIEGQYSGAIYRIGSIAAGTMIPYAICTKRKRRYGGVKKHNR